MGYTAVGFYSPLVYFGPTYNEGFIHPDNILHSTTGVYSPQASSGNDPSVYNVMVLSSAIPLNPGGTSTLVNSAHS